MRFFLQHSENDYERGLSRLTKTRTVDSETRLVSDAQSGNVQAYERLYRSHAGNIYALCLRMAKEQNAAEEATQEAFIKAWEKLPDFSGDSAFGTWLHRIAVNTVLTHMRRDSRYRNRVVPHGEASDQEIIEVVTTVSHPERMDMEEALRHLPDNARTVFILHEMEGYRHDEIAEMTGVTVGTSKSQLHRARKLLQEYLK